MSLAFDPGGAAPTTAASGMLASLCRGESLVDVVEFPGVPVHVSALWPTRDAARACPRGDMVLAFCPGSGLLVNRCFDAGVARYRIAHDKGLGASPVFREYERALAERLVMDDDLRDARIVEVGCEDGHLLGLVCSLAGGRGLGYEPGFESGRDASGGAEAIEIRPEAFTGALDGPADLIIMRHVLEHLADPLDALRRVAATLRANSSDGAGLYVEVPNGLLALRRLSIWDLIYEHATYFTVPSLERLLAAAGFEVRRIGDAYDGQFVVAHARLADGPFEPPARAEELEALRRDVEDFPARLNAEIDRWSRRVADLGGGPNPAVAWGAGAKAVGFFNLLGIDDEVVAVVDLNERKQGSFLPGTGHRIVAPAELTSIAPGLVIAMNPIYVDEITADLARLGIDAPVVPVS